MPGILDLLRARTAAAPGAQGVLDVLNFPELDPLQQQWRQTQYAAPASPSAPAWARLTDATSPPRAPGTLAPQQGAPAQTPMNWDGFNQSAGNRPPPAAPAPRRTAGPDLSRVLPGDAPALEPFTSAPLTEAAPIGETVGPDQRSMLGRFFDRFQQPMGDGNLTPMDGLSLGMQLMGAGEASWDVNQPSGWSRAGDAVNDTVQAANDRAFQNEQRQQWRAENTREGERFGWERTDRGRADEQRAAVMASIQDMPEGPEKDWALTHPEEYARIRLAELAQSGSQQVSDGFIWTAGPNGELTRGEEVPLSAAQRADRDVQMARIAADGGAAGVGRLTPNALASARDQFAAIDMTRSQLGRVTDMLSRMSDTQLASQLGTENSTFLSALTDLQMSLKDQYELGALAGPDQALLRAVTGDPREFVSFLRRGGGEGMQGALGEVGARIGLSENRLRTQYAPWSETAGLRDLYNRAPPEASRPTQDLNVDAAGDAQLRAAGWWQSEDGGWHPPDETPDSARNNTVRNQGVFASGWR